MTTGLLVEKIRAQDLIKTGLAIIMTCIGLAVLIVTIQPLEAASRETRPQVQDYLSRSQRLLEQRKVDEAQRVLEKGIAAFKKSGHGDSLEGLELQLNLGAVFFQKGDFSEALKRFEHARVTRQKTLGIAHEHTRMAYHNVTATFLALKKPDDAIDILLAFVRADETQSSPNLANEIWAFDWIKDIQLGKRDYENALVTSEKLRGLCLRFNPNVSNNCYLKYYVLSASEIYEALGELSAAKDILKNVLSVVQRNAENLRTLTTININLSLLSRKENQYASAIAILRETLHDLDRMNELASEEGVNALLTLGELYIDLDDANSAETLADKAIEIVLTAKGLPQDNPAFLRAYAVLGSVLAMRGSDVAAIQALEFAFQQHARHLTIADQDYRKYGYALLDAYLRFGLLTQATEFSNTLSQQSGFDSNDKSAAPFLVRLCAAQRLAKQLQPASETCEKAAALVKQADQTTRNALRIALELSITYFELGRCKDAAEVAIRVLSAGLEAKSDRFQFRSEIRGLTEVALRSLAKAGLEESTSRDILFRTLQVVFATQDEEKVARMQQLRGSIQDDSARRLALHREYLRSRLERAERRQQSLAFSSENFKSESTSRTIAKGLEAEINRVREALTRDDQNGAVILSENEIINQPVGLANIQASLGNDKTLLLYTVFETRSALVTIRDGVFSVNIITASRQQLADLVKKTRPGSSSFRPPHGRTQPLEGFDPTAAAELYRLIWKPADAFLADATRVYVVPDGPLSELAFPALLTAETETPVKLDDIRRLPFLAKADYAIVLLPEVKAALDNKAKPARLPYFVGVGNPIVPPCSQNLNELVSDAVSDAIDSSTLGCALKALPAAGKELAHVSDLFKPDARTVLQGPDASEANLRRLSERGILTRATLLLIATHGLAPGELQFFTDPMRLAKEDHIGVPTVGDVTDDLVRRHTSIPFKQLHKLEGMFVYNWYRRDVPDTRYTFPPGLVLSVPDNTNDHESMDATNDGFLSSSEISALDIGADLVILSACNTAAQESAGTSAIFSGLSRSFLAAGAKSLIVTQWAVVSDAAAAMTTGLTRIMALGGPRGSQALHRVMNDILEHGDDPHPFVWAAFTFVGTAGAF